MRLMTHLPFGMINSTGVLFECHLNTIDTEMEAKPN